MFDLKNLTVAIEQLQEVKQLPKETLIAALESAFAAAYKKEYGKHDQVIRCRFNLQNGDISFQQVKKIVTDEDLVEKGSMKMNEEDERVVFNGEKHILLDTARMLQAGATRGGEITFPLESKADFGRIAAQAAKQAITQKLNDAERESVIIQFQGKADTIVNGVVQRFERGNLYVDLGKTIAILPFQEQMRNERLKQGDTVRAYITEIDSSRKHGGFIRLSRADTRFVAKLFEQEVPEISQGVVQIKGIVRDPGSRTKIAVLSSDTSIDPVGALVGQRGSRVMAIKNELHGEQIDIMEFNTNQEQFIEDALSPADILDISINKEAGEATVKVSNDQIPVTIGRGGQNIRLAAKLTGFNLIVLDQTEDKVAYATKDGDMEILKAFERPVYASRNEIPQETPAAVAHETPATEEAPQAEPVVESAPENNPAE